MAWEWHERRRKNGRFVPDWAHALKGALYDQIHIRMMTEEAVRVRDAAAGNLRELGDYCRTAIMERVQKDEANRANWVKVPRRKTEKPSNTSDRP